MLRLFLVNLVFISSNDVLNPKTFLLLKRFIGCEFSYCIGFQIQLLCALDIIMIYDPFKLSHANLQFSIENANFSSFSFSYCVFIDLASASSSSMIFSNCHISREHDADPIVLSVTSVDQYR